MIPPTTEEAIIAFGPERAASKPPVAAPLMIAFQGSSFPRIPAIKQSPALNMPDQTAKFPPSTGALTFMLVTIPDSLSPLGEFL